MERAIRAYSIPIAMPLTRSWGSNDNMPGLLQRAVSSRGHGPAYRPARKGRCGCGRRPRAAPASLVRLFAPAAESVERLAVRGEDHLVPVVVEPVEEHVAHPYVLVVGDGDHACREVGIEVTQRLDCRQVALTRQIASGPAEPSTTPMPLIIPK